MNYKVLKKLLLSQVTDRMVTVGWTSTNAGHQRRQRWCAPYPLHFDLTSRNSQIKKKPNTQQRRRRRRRSYIIVQIENRIVPAPLHYIWETGSRWLTGPSSELIWSLSRSCWPPFKSFSICTSKRYKGGWASSRRRGRNKTGKNNTTTLVGAKADGPAKGSWKTGKKK